jgi:hypothetical protein
MSERESRRREAYRTANRLLTSAGIALALEGVRPHAPELEAIRRALRAVNVAGGIEIPRKEGEKRAFIPGGGRFPKAG